MQNRLYELFDAADEDNDYVNAGPDEDAEDIAHTTGSFDPEDANINTAYNYGYDKRGNLIRDTREGITAIDWTVAGKVRGVTKSTGPSLTFGYGRGGQRTLKQVGDPDLGSGFREHYIRDAQGNIMAIYRYTNSGGASTQVVERPVYGSSRLGSYVKPQEVMGPGLISVEHTMPLTAADQRYELTDHLGNVSTVVTGRLLDGAGAGSQKQAEVVLAHGYEPFGSLLPGRNYSSDSYRFGFNGKENDKEVHGAVGTFQDYGMRMYDTRVGRFFSVDPLSPQYPYYTPYQFAGNKPIRYIDRDGLEEAEHKNNWFVQLFIDLMSPPPLSGDLNENRHQQNKFMEWQERQTKAAQQVETATKVIESTNEALVNGVAGVGLIPGVDVVTDPVLALYFGARGDRENATAYTAGILIPGVSGAAFRGAGQGLRYVMKNTDMDLRGTGVVFRDALEAAFERTGISKDQFNITKWGKTKDGKSIPVEFRAQNGAEVSIDFPHTNNGPDAPHIGWQTGGKRNSGGAERGHIILDDVPAGR